MPPTPGATGRAPGAFSPLPTPSTQASYQSQNQTPGLRRVDSSYSDESPLTVLNSHPQNEPAQRPPNVFTTFQSNTSTGSLQNFSRPAPSHASSGACASDLSLRTASPLTLPPRAGAGDFSKSHVRKNSNSAGFFEPTLPATSTINPGTANPGAGMPPNPNLSASQIAAQAAMQHQNQHMRQRSQTLPNDNMLYGQRKSSRGPASPPMLSLTEASGERPSGFGGISTQGGQSYRNGFLGKNTSAAATAANVVFQRSPQTSPSLSPAEYSPSFRDPEKPAKPEKTSKVKLFSRPGKISTKDTKEKPMPSPNKLGSLGLAGLQRHNMSTASLTDSIISGGSSMYSMANSSSATIRPIETPVEKDKEKKHHFLSRQKHKLSGKDDHHLPLSSAASNSRPADPSAPSSLYNFSLPPSPGQGGSFAKSMSGLDLRHGGRALREKKKEEKAAAGLESNLRESEAVHNNELLGPSSLGSTAGASFWGPPGSLHSTNLYGIDPQELARYGLNNMTADDAWPFLKARLLIIFEGEDLRLPVEDFNRLVIMHLQRCIQKRSPNIIVEDIRDLLTTGFSSLDQVLRRTQDDTFITRLVELWLVTFTSILPYMQAVFLPLDLEFAGHGSLMTPEQARDFWGALPRNSSAAFKSNASASNNIPASQVLDVRRIVLTAYRDTVILPRFDTLKTMFSRLSLESINSHHLQNPAPLSDTLSSSPDSFARPGTAMSLDPSLSSYNSQATTLLSGADSSGARSRAISNVSYGSDSAVPAYSRGDPSMPPPARPFTPSSLGVGLGLGGGSGLGRERERERDMREREVNATESKRITETVGRMLQCMSVLASVGSGDDEDAQKKMEELCRALKLNWLGRGRTGRNRRGLVGARIRKEDTSIAVAVS